MTGNPVPPTNKGLTCMLTLLSVLIHLFLPTWKGKKKKTSINKQVHAYTDARMYVIIVIGVVRGSQSLESRFLFNHRTKLAKSVQ